MTTTFSDYVAQQDARNNIQLNVRKWTLMLTNALEDNFKSRYPGGHPYKFVIECGSKYHKIVLETISRHRSIHAFVDKKTGEVYKAASFKGPAKGVRFDLRLIKDREWLFENADWEGSYLDLVQPTPETSSPMKTVTRIDFDRFMYLANNTFIFQNGTWDYWGYLESDGSPCEIKALKFIRSLLKGSPDGMIEAAFYEFGHLILPLPYVVDDDAKLEFYQHKAKVQAGRMSGLQVDDHETVCS